MRCAMSYHATVPSDVHMAARWALTTQHDLMTVPWPAEIANSALCKTEVVDGHTVFCGPRVRMAIHVGEPTASLNPLTKRVVYTGPVVNKAWRVCFTADGGTLADPFRDRLICSREPAPT